jgi:hypothetical protein
MARRPVFTPTADGVEVRLLIFEWHPGLSLAQKQKSIASLHSAAIASGVTSPLEVSTRSTVHLGRELSAMKLLVDLPGVGRVPVECAFQGSKAFERGGPFTDLYPASPREAKRDGRLKSSGRLVAFRLPEEEWPLEPKTAFYDWLYITALTQHPELAAGLSEYDGFTDIEFNPLKSLNTQARSCALYVALARTRTLDQVTADRAVFLKSLAEIYRIRDACHEPGLFGFSSAGKLPGKPVARGRRGLPRTRVKGD